MMDVELNAWRLFEHAERHHADVEIVSQRDDGSLHRYTYGDFSPRAQQLMHALDRLGVERGCTVATLAWNGHRHLEAYFGVPCSGRVLHTLNARLSPSDLAYIIGHADDRVVMVESDLVPLLEQAADALDRVTHIIVLDTQVPSTTLPHVVGYEDLIADQPARYAPVEIPERAPLGLCYTSGTTGRPKGVVYTHRSTVLHALGVMSGSGMAIGPQDCVLPVVPMFHANAWGLPHAATAAGAMQVFGAPHLDPARLLELLGSEAVTVAAGVPTIWIALAEELRRSGASLPHLRHLFCGGAQPPRALIEEYRQRFGIPLVQVWGMTETSPIASVAWPRAAMREWSDERLADTVLTQAGLPLPCVSISVRGDDGREPDADGKAMGELLVRGPWILDEYLHGEGSDRFTDDGWFCTGDVAVRSPSGYFVIADRVKDLIKSGGEWISSVDMESDIMAVPGVVEAAVVGVADDKWGERPLACVVLRPGATLTAEELRSHLTDRGWARWQLPQRIEVLDGVPRTSVGKFDKRALRARYAAEVVQHG